jgi:hypothetical protein
MSDEGSSGSGSPPEEGELAGYLDELISASLSQRESDAQTCPAEENPAETRPNADVGRVRRASMRDELLALFRDTGKRAAVRHPTVAESSAEDVAPPRLSSGATPFSTSAGATPGEPAPRMTPREASIADAASSAPAAPAQSVFLQRFLRQVPCAANLPSSGISDLDTRLGGGLSPGLHVLAGPPGAGKTAFMLSVVWEAVSARRPAVYFAFREGSLRVWMRLVATLASFQESSGGPPLTLTQLRAGRLGPEQLELLSRLDHLLQASVLPLLSMVDTISTYVTTLDAFAEDVRARSRELAQKHGPVPLLLVDDLDRLLLRTPEQSLVHALALLDEVLRDECASGLVAANLTDPLIEAADALPARTVLFLEEAVEKLEEGFGRADLQVTANAPTGWKGTLPLLLDVSSGLFALDPTTPERAREQAPSDLAPTPPPALPFSC